MAKMKKIVAKIKLQIPGGQATPAPPVGPALGQHQVNIMEFCKAYNAKTKDEAGSIVPVEITVYEDKSFTFVTKTSPASFLLKQKAAIEKASSEPNRVKVATITPEQLNEIAKSKISDMNANDIEAAEQMIRGTARSMGIVVKE